MTSPAQQEENDRAIYVQDCESFQYQDKLFWSRFQTLSVIEGASIGVIFTNTIKGFPSIIMAFGTMFIVGLISMVAFKDRRDSKNFIRRMYDYEHKNDAMEINPDRYFKVGFLSFPFDSLIFTRVVSVLLAVFNIYLIIYTFMR